MFNISDRKLLLSAILILVLNLVIWKSHPIPLIFFLLLSFILLKSNRALFLRFLVAIVVLGSYFFVSYHHFQRDLTSPSSKQFRILADDYDINGDLLTFQAECEGQLFLGTYTLGNENEKEFWQTNASHQIIIVKLKKSSPQVTSESYKEYLHCQGVDGVITVQSIETRSSSPNSSLKDWCATLRRYLILYAQSIMSEEAAEYILALCFGFQTANFKQLLMQYQFLGIGHLFALSGMHVNVIMKGFMKLLYRMRVTKETSRYYFFFGSIIYYFLSGSSLTILRSLLQANLVNLGINQRQSYFLTFILIIMYYPPLTFNTGVCLSFIISFILIMYGDQVKSSLNFTLATLPFHCYYFSNYQVLSILYSPFFTFIFKKIVLPLSFVSMAFYIFLPPYVFEILIKKVDLLKDICFKIAPRELIIGKPSIWILSVWIIAMISYFERESLRKLSLVCIVLCFLYTKFPITPQIEVISSGLENYLIIKQWPSKVIVFSAYSIPKSKNRESWRQRSQRLDIERVLMPKLKEMGVGHIDYWIQESVTDRHLSSLSKVNERIKVRHLKTFYQISHVAEKELNHNGIKFSLFRHETQVFNFQYQNTCWKGRINGHKFLIRNSKDNFQNEELDKIGENDIAIIFTKFKIKESQISSISTSKIISGDSIFSHQLTLYDKSKLGIDLQETSHINIVPLLEN